MKTITINLNIKNLPPNILPEGVIACPRVGILKGKIVSGRFVDFKELNEAKDFRVGQFTETFNLEDDEALKVEAYCWDNQNMDFISETFVTSRTAGGNKDQIWKNTIVDKAGEYNIIVDII